MGKKENTKDQTRRNFLRGGLTAGGAAALVGLAPGELVAQQNERQAVQTATAEADVAQMRAAPGGGFTYRQDWGQRHGEWLLNLNWPPGFVTDDSSVYCSVSEADANGIRFVGLADFQLFNVSPRQDLIQIVVNINWGSDIRLFVDYLIFT